MPSRELLLLRYSHYDPHPDRNSFFFRISLLASLLLFGSLGIYLNRQERPLDYFEQQRAGIKTQFIMPEPQKLVFKQPEPQKKDLPRPEEPIDLTKSPVLKQEQDRPAEQEKTAEKKQVRRVYGLRRVYSTGIGASGSAEDAIVGKIGNTLDTDFDTITASREDLAGELVSISSIDKPPRLIGRIKPEYAPEMIENRIEGVIRARVLIDIDGKVKDVEVLNDLGFGSGVKAREAFYKLRFEPALRDGEPKAVWIIVRFRFEMIDS